MKNKEIILHIVLGAFILMGVSIWNGYPLLYSDSSTYLASGFNLQTPYDRPINYGLFLRFASFNGLSLWFVVLFQSLMVSFLLFLTLKNTLKKINNFYFYLTLVSLQLFTGIGFITGQLITDIFMSICILSMYNFVFFSNSKINQILLVFLFLIATSTHMSHIGINIIILFSMLLCISLHKKMRIIIGLKKVIVLIIVTVTTIFTMGSTVSKSKHVFLTARMAGSGLLQQYLNENCHLLDLKLCDNINSIPYNTNDFLWEDSSVLNKHYNNWLDSKSDFDFVISNTFFNWKYFKLHIRDIFYNGSKQLLNFKVGDGNGSFNESSLLYKRIKKFTNSDIILHKRSKQYNKKILFNNLISLNMFYTIVVLLSLIFLFFLLFRNRRKITTEYSIFLIFIFYAIIINSFLNSGLVIIADRFGAKLIWFLPFIFILTFLFIKSKLNNSQGFVISKTIQKK